VSSGCKCRSTAALKRTNSAPPNPLAGFEGPLRGREERGKEKKGDEKEIKERDGREGRKHPLK